MQSDGHQQVAAGGRDYEAVAASATAQVLGAVGALGDTLDFVWVFPATTTPGAISILDNGVTIWTLSGATLADIKPFIVPIQCRSKNGAWKITTGANVSALAVGLFTN